VVRTDTSSEPGVTQVLVVTIKFSMIWYDVWYMLKVENKIIASRLFQKSFDTLRSTSYIMSTGIPLHLAYTPTLTGIDLSLQPPADGISSLSFSADSSRLLVSSWDSVLSSLSSARARTNAVDDPAT
jgi:hypothetical protein